MKTQHSIVMALLTALSLGSLVGCESDGGGGGQDAQDTIAPADTDKPINDTGTRNNGAPELQRIGDRVAAAGQALIIEVVATDPNGDDLTYSVFGSLPDGARFDKAAHRFEWTPETIGQTVFLTFVVSDGAEFDRETVRIEVTAEGGSHAPQFVQVGDQQLTVNTDYVLELEATDPDGQTLSYGHEGALPVGASLDSQSGRFLWRPNADAMGNPVRVTFTVTDSSLSDSMAVRFVVTDGQTSGPAPPEFTELPPQTGHVGQELSFDLSASDPNGDTIAFAVASGAPEDATLSGPRFSFTPGAAQAGFTFNVVFSANDGTFTAFTTVQIDVKAASTGGPCTPEASNDSVATAEAIATGTLAAEICDDLEMGDLDIFAISIPAGQQLTATLTWQAAADLDLYLVSGDEEFLQISEGVTNTEQIVHASETTQTLYLVVTAFGADKLVGIPYSMVTELGEATLCQDDALEDNDTPAQARPFPGETADLQICPADPDYWTFSASCGQAISVGLDIQGTGADLDMGLYDNTAEDGAPVALAVTEDAFEIIELPSAPTTGTYLLRVDGYPLATTQSPYNLLVDVSGPGCVPDDYEGSVGPSSAAPLSGASGTVDVATICCASDWFWLATGAGDLVTVDVSPESGGSAGISVYGPDGSTQIDSAEPDTAGAILQFTAPGDAIYIEVAGSVDAVYALAWESEAGSGSCDDLSCGIYEVCDSASGQCVSDFCVNDNECPADYLCHETYCANLCDGDSQCRVGYSCIADGVCMPDGWDS